MCCSKVILTRSNGTRLCQSGKMTTLTMRDEKRLDVIQRVCRSELIVEQAALVMGRGHSGLSIDLLGSYDVYLPLWPESRG